MRHGQRVYPDGKHFILYERHRNVSWETDYGEWAGICDQVRRLRESGRYEYVRVEKRPIVKGFGDVNIWVL